MQQLFSDKHIPCSREPQLQDFIAVSRECLNLDTIRPWHMNEANFGHHGLHRAHYQNAKVG